MLFRSMENMERCLQCHSSLKKEETICWACNAPVPEKNPKTSAHSRFQTFLNFLFKFCAVLMVAALLTPAGYTPSFMKCVAAFLVVALVRSSMLNMTDAKKDAR